MPSLSTVGPITLNRSDLLAAYRLHFNKRCVVLSGSSQCGQHGDGTM